MCTPIQASQIGAGICMKGYVQSLACMPAYLILRCTARRFVGIKIAHEKDVSQKRLWMRVRKIVDALSVEFARSYFGLLV